MNNIFKDYDYFIITDIDNTLLGDRESSDLFLKFIENNKTRIGFGVATGRPLQSAINILKENNFNNVDLVISSVGIDISYQNGEIPDNSWNKHIDNKWNRIKIIELLKNNKSLTLQPDDFQNKYKVSYFADFPDFNLSEIKSLLEMNNIYYTIIYSHNEYLDILPERASKAKAVSFFSENLILLLIK